MGWGLRRSAEQLLSSPQFGIDFGSVLEGTSLNSFDNEGHLDSTLFYRERALR